MPWAAVEAQEAQCWKTHCWSAVVVELAVQLRLSFAEQVAFG